MHSSWSCFFTPVQVHDIGWITGLHSVCSGLGLQLGPICWSGVAQRQQPWPCQQAESAHSTIQKGTLLTLQCNTQDKIHTVFWWQFIVLQMFLFNLEGHLNRNRNIILWVDRNQSVSHHCNWTGAVMWKVQFIYKNKTEMIKDVHWTTDLFCF